jgi:hypothetical protein
VPWFLALVGLALALGLISIARPAEIWVLLAGSRPRAVAAAASLTVLTACVRGARLAILSGGRLAPSTATAVSAAAQLAVSVLPWRLGELALIPLLRVAGLPGAVRGLAYAGVGRLLDAAALALLAAAAAVLLPSFPPLVAGALAAPLAIVAASFLVLQRRLGTMARRWRLARGWRTRALRPVLRTRRELRQVARRRFAVAAAAACSLAVWLSLWGVTVILLEGMGVSWPAGAALAGVIGAAAGVALPINVAGNFGSLEGGWAVALALAGVPPSQSLAAGFATHSWSLLFNVVFGVGGGAFLALSRSGSPDRAARDCRTNSRRPSRDP